MNARPVVEVEPFSDPRAHCTTCRASAHWLVAGTASCDEHLPTWLTFHVQRAERTH